MADYRLYCLSGDGHIASAEWIEADSDEEAIAMARKRRPGPYRCEIWLKSHLVATLNSDGTIEGMAV